MALFTDLLKLVEQATGENEQLWGEVLENSFITLAEEAIAGKVEVDMTTGDQTLTDFDGVSSQARHMIIAFTGTPVLGVTVFVPKRQKLYIFDNQCGQVVTVRTTTGISAVIQDNEIVVCVVDEGLDRVLKMVIHDKNIIARFSLAGVMTAFPGTINIDAGATVPVVYQLVEGDFATFFSEQTTFTMTAATATTFSFLLAPGLLQDSLRDQSFSLFIRQNAVVIRMFANITLNTIQFFVEDPATLLLASAVIIVPSFQFTQSIAPNP